MLNLEIIGEGATTKIYREGNRTIKLYVNASIGEVKNEARLQSYAVKMGLPVPAIYGVRKIDKFMIALEMEYIPGNPLMGKKMKTNERHAAILTLVRLQCSIHSINANGLSKQRDKTKLKIERNVHIDKAIKESLLVLLEN